MGARSPAAAVTLPQGERWLRGWRGGGASGSAVPTLWGDTGRTWGKSSGHGAGTAPRPEEGAAEPPSPLPHSHHQRDKTHAGTPLQPPHVCPGDLGQVPTPHPKAISLWGSAVPPRLCHGIARVALQGHTHSTAHVCVWDVRAALCPHGAPFPPPTAQGKVTHPLVGINNSAASLALLIPIRAQAQQGSH